MKLATAPSRSPPTRHCTTPTSSVTVSTSSMYSALPAGAIEPSEASSASDSALVGPDITCRLEPNSAATAHGTIAV